MASIRQNILDALVTRLAAISGWSAQLRGSPNSIGSAAVAAIVAPVSEDKSITTADQYQATLQVLVWIVCNAEDADGVLDGGNAYRYLDRLVTLAEKAIHDPDEWGLDPAFTDVQIVGHDVSEPTEDNQVAAQLRLQFRYRHSYQDPEA